MNLKGVFCELGVGSPDMKILREASVIGMKVMSSHKKVVVENVRWKEVMVIFKHKLGRLEGVEVVDFERFQGQK